MAMVGQPSTCPGLPHGFDALSPALLGRIGRDGSDHPDAQRDSVRMLVAEPKNAIHDRRAGFFGNLLSVCTE